MSIRENGIQHIIAKKHGCHIVPGAFGTAHIEVLDRWRQGDPVDAVRRQDCRREMVALGLPVSGLVGGEV